jgi:multiple antibiotic resistance protein
MTDIFGFSLLAFTSLLAMIDPIGLIPIFLAATSGYSEKHRRSTIKRAILASFAILVIFGMIGMWIFKVFNVTPHAFRVAGGIVLFRIGLDMLQAKRSRTKTTKEEEEASAEKDDIAIVPLAIPLIAGPGAMTALVALMSEAKTLSAQISIYSAIAMVLAITWVSLIAAPRIARYMGPNGMNVTERIIALLVTVIGVQFILDGIEGAFVAFLQNHAPKWIS